MSHAQALAMCNKVECIIADRIVGQPHTVELGEWIRNLDDTIRSRLARVGLVGPSLLRKSTVGSMLEQFFASLSVKASTVIVYGQTRRNLLEFFGRDRLLRTITGLDAEKWRQYLVRSGLEQATVSKRVKTARQAFKRAVKWGMIEVNPFADVTAGSQANKSRMRFIGRADCAKILAACPDGQWRLIVALSRFGGLRCPSEVLALKWSDVDWDRERIRVPSCKTEHYVGRESREIPLFPEIKPHLLEAFDVAEPGTEHVIWRYRTHNKNLRTQFHRIIRRAGVTPWPKPFHNMRSTRQTELAAEHPIHVVCYWLGNSRAIAQEHYLQITDADFARAVKAAQNPAQSGAELARDGSQAGIHEKQNRPVLPSDSTPCELVQDFDMTPTGFEPVSRP